MDESREGSETLLELRDLIAGLTQILFKFSILLLGFFVFFVNDMEVLLERLFHLLVHQLEFFVLSLSGEKLSESCLQAFVLLVST